METYTILRAFADSWFLLAMFCFFIAACALAFWPSQRRARQEAAEIPLRDDTPADVTPQDATNTNTNETRNG
ncbi:CcoQ/FixQ family Cbb3-type cytochrome c oxidase assembly chaperone [Candidatus Rhodobacter oscarellae]|uniref:CcoQ/FixQ family Cbb3-type cytochrome c oxidase assembly chaperone n=1 Tax=Candidatus Rhodobacter oscarellae TaxID=1675527 RepID=UPI000671118A|nr:CcoQ/FixQ family Cbb3-type cytochrome c oxidase assembly chaperone [Candidatus Rhodobacter lobularis]